MEGHPAFSINIDSWKYLGLDKTLYVCMVRVGNKRFPYSLSVSGNRGSEKRIAQFIYDKIKSYVKKHYSEIAHD